MAQDTITPRATDYAQWYQDVIQAAELAQPAEVVKGCMVVRPHGWAVWEKLQSALDTRFKATGHQNAAFPMLMDGVISSAPPERALAPTGDFLSALGPGDAEASASTCGAAAGSRRRGGDRRFRAGRGRR